MAVAMQEITNKYAIYCGDCVDVMNTIPKDAVDMSIYSPPFAGLYIYSSDARDLSNNISREKFLEHYEFVVAEVARLTKPGRITLVHTADVPMAGQLFLICLARSFGYMRSTALSIPVGAASGRSHWASLSEPGLFH